MVRFFRYLKKFRKGKIIIDSNYPDHSLYPTSAFDTWKELYPDAKEILPNKSEIPSEKGPLVRLTVFKDADHAHDIFTSRCVDFKKTENR